jgi:predicted glycoside hydrolase/deacetylase ChbG (UPF0249 family)
MKVIVNADDLGASREVNDAIFGLMRDGRVSSATIMANGPAVEEVLRDVSRFPMCSFGIHLNLTQYPPLHGGARLAAIVRDGEFARDRIRRVRPTPRLLLGVFEEWTAQVERVRAGGVRVSHFDSHHHVHTIPFLLPAVKALMAKTGVRRLRISKNLYSKELPTSRAKLAQKAALNAAFRHVLPRARTTAVFTEFQSFYDLVRGGARLTMPSIELMAHPGAGSDLYRRETELIAAHPVHTLFTGARLVSYHDV